MVCIMSIPHICCRNLDDSHSSKCLVPTNHCHTSSSFRLARLLQGALDTNASGGPIEQCFLRILRIRFSLIIYWNERSFVCYRWVRKRFKPKATLENLWMCAPVCFYAPASVSEAEFAVCNTHLTHSGDTFSCLKRIAMTHFNRLLGVCSHSNVCFRVA